MSQRIAKNCGRLLNLLLALLQQIPVYQLECRPDREAVQLLHDTIMKEEVAGDTLLVPVGETALHFNGILALEPVGALIWKGLSAGKDRDQILCNILDQFEIDAQTAGNDLDEFLQQLRSENLLTD